MRRAGSGDSGALAAASVLALVLLLVLLRAPPAAVQAETLSGLGSILPSFIVDNLEELVKAASASCETLPLDILFSRQFAVDVPHLSVVEFTRAGRRTYRASRAHVKLQAHRPAQLVIYVPGWWNTPTDESSAALVTALLNKHPIVIVLDTRLSFCRGYIASASRVKAVSHLLYNLIKNLDRSGISISSIHLIGFSLGAHVAGMAGKLVQKGLNGKIGKITALDPAKPCFARSEYRLEKGDAMFVQVVHSSAGVLGLEEPIGHADIYVNGVSVKQPECMDRSISLECDHAQAWKLYSASVMNDQSLMGRQCNTWDELMRSNCSGDVTVLGYGCSTNSRGMFLYKSEGSKQRSETQLKVFNPFDLRTWWHS